jgi:hypothetical protein
VTSSANFLLFSNLPKDRAAPMLKALEARATMLKRLLGPVLDFPEKLSVYVFNDAATYVEFARAVESRDLEPGSQVHGNFGVKTPYLAAYDALGGREDEAAKKRPAKAKRGEDAGGPERSLTGLLVEQLVASGTAMANKAPRWLCLGLGAYYGSQVEPRSPYYRHLRDEAARQYMLGWNAKAQEALGDVTDADKVRAIGFSLVEWQNATDRARFTSFARMMLDGPEKLDEVVMQIWGASRDDFLREWGMWVAASYGRGG